jgi:hypothetical protein
LPNVIGLGGKADETFGETVNSYASSGLRARTALVSREIFEEMALADEFVESSRCRQAIGSRGTSTGTATTPGAT